MIDDSVKKEYLRDIEKEMTLYCIQKPLDMSTFETATVNLYNRMF
jgi:hypothetical protein